MAENLGKRPTKGILKTSSSFEKSDSQKPKCKETKWDEINILATLHPPDKDYGLTKIDEPKTPYNYWDDGETHSGDEANALDADVLAARIQHGANLPPKILMQEEIDEEEEEELDEEEEELDEEEREKRMIFDAKRKAHYNEFHAIKLARKLMERDDSEEDEDEAKDCIDVEQKECEAKVIESKDDPSSSTLRTE